MKRKLLFVGIALLTFYVGFTLVSLLSQKTDSSRQVDVVDFVEPVAFASPVAVVEAQNSMPEHPKRLAAIEILRFDPEFEVNEIKFEDLSGDSVDFDLDLAHSIENQIIALHPFPNDRREFKIEQQFETSMTVSAEGPHLDLTDWKHYTSEWKEIKMLEGNKFLTSKVPESDYDRFPRVGTDDIYKAVLKRGDKSWADYARNCKGPNDYPCLVTTSRISFRIKAKENGKWNIIHKINVFIPMGC